MTSLLIASKSFCDGQAIADRVADLLGIRLLGPEVYREAAAEHSVTEEQLHQAIVEPPSLFGMTSTRRARCLAYFTAALTRLLRDDDAVYFGPGGPYVIHGVPHVIRVSVIGDSAKRAERMASSKGIQLARAATLIAAEDHSLERCAELVFDVEPTDPPVFDLEVNIDRGGIEAAAKTIADAAGEARFLPTSYSTRCLRNTVLAAQVRAKLIHQDPEIQVSAEDGVVSVRPHVTGRARERTLASIRKELATLPGVRSLEIAPVISGDIFGR